MESIQISIIVPCYNVEKYIVDTLHSIFEQVNDNIEVVIINDGSTDNTHSKVIEFINRYGHNEQVVYFSQSNNGVSHARNKGLELSKGEYISFLDGDDLLKNDYFKKITYAINNFNPDIIEFNADRFIYPNKKTTEVIICKSDGLKIISKTTDMYDTFFDSKWYVWGRVFKKYLLNDAKFDINRRYEDALFTPFIYLRSKKIYSINESLIWYRQNPASITNNPIKKDVDDVVYFMRKVDGYISTGNEIVLTATKATMFFTLNHLCQRLYKPFCKPLFFTQERYVLLSEIERLEIQSNLFNTYRKIKYLYIFNSYMNLRERIKKISNLFF